LEECLGGLTVGYALPHGRSARWCSPRIDPVVVTSLAGPSAARPFVVHETRDVPPAFYLGT
jgi:hypothetical protein